MLGASQGIGRSIAEQLAAAGCNVTLTARTEDSLFQITKSLPGKDHKFFAGDHSDLSQFMSQVDEQIQHNGNFDIVVFNSGGPPAGKMSEARSKDFMEPMARHLGLASEIVGRTVDHMKDKKYGRYVAVTSTSVKIPIPHLGVSNTVRAAMASYLKTLSLELAPFGITVNNLMPGFTETPRLESLMEGAANKQGKSVEEIRKAWIGQVPAGRFAQPNELAYLATFLCSDFGGYITGQNIPVDGGRLGCL